jgi:hypothetical protein
MKQWCVFAAAFLFLGICLVSAEDRIIMKNGSTFGAKVVEVSPTEIKYKRVDHLDGPTYSVPTADVHSIRYENGREEVISYVPPPPPPPPPQEATPKPRPGQGVTGSRTTARDRDRDTDGFYWGISGNPGGALLEGTSFGIEFGKGRFNSEINLIFPSLGGLLHDVDKGFGVLAMFNGFWPSNIGGGYLGGGLGLVYQHRYVRYTKGAWYTEGYFDEFIFTFGANGGYKFVMSSGLSLRVGGYLGLAFGYADRPVNVYFKPDLAVGWSFQ